MKKVTKIDKIQNVTTQKQKLRVAAYCRVSTSNDAQLESLETQKAHYESYITSRDDWQFAGLYFDEGITGTKKDKRPELMRLMQDCAAKKIDFVITKSISRFSRNTTDCLELVRKLQELDVPIYFEKENINTGSMESELFLTILSSMARVNPHLLLKTASGQCHARTINELDLQEIVLTALNELLGDKSKYQKQLQQNIAEVIRASAAITTDGIDEKLMELQQELVKKANNKEAYDEIADQIFALREKRQQASMDTVQRDEQLQRITELQDFIKDQSSDLTVFDEALVKRWLKQITIWPTHCTVELKSGLKVDVER